MRAATKGEPDSRPKLEQKLPEAIVAGLLGIIRRQFEPELTDDEWFKGHQQFIRRNVVLWPARFLVGKGFTISGARYEQILREVLNEIKRHGQTGQVRYWPGYLMKCVQEHFRHHWEEYYAEAKSAGAQTEAALLALRALPRAAGPDTLSVLAATHRLLQGPKRRGPRAARQGELGL